MGNEKTLQRLSDVSLEMIRINEEMDGGEWNDVECDEARIHLNRIITRAASFLAFTGLSQTEVLSTLADCMDD